MISIETLRRGGVTVVRVEGDVDEDGAQQLRKALVNCLRDSRFMVVLNLAGMKFISYMGVGVLVERLRQFRVYNGDMKLVGLNFYTDRLFNMTGVTSLFEVFETEAEAIRQSQKVV